MDNMVIIIYNYLSSPSGLGSNDFTTIMKGLTSEKALL